MNNNQSANTAHPGATDNKPIPNQTNTFNFYSPKPIGPIEAAEEVKKVQKQLAEGFI